MLTGFEFEDFYDEVIDRVGGQQTTAEDVIRVRRGIRIVLERWEAQGFNTWRIRMHPAYAPGGTRWIQLPDEVDDVLHVMLPEGGEVSRIPPAGYIKISNKDQRGRPSSYWLSREEGPRLFLHPTGDNTPLEVWHVERPAAFSAARTDTGDVPGRWLEAMITAVAHDVARKRPGEGGGYNEQLIGRLDAERREAEEIAHRADRDRSRYRYRIA